jgi:hypothetical protein
MIASFETIIFSPSSARKGAVYRTLTPAREDSHEVRQEGVAELRTGGHEFIERIDAERPALGLAVGDNVGGAGRAIDEREFPAFEVQEASCG